MKHRLIPSASLHRWAAAGLLALLPAAGAHADGPDARARPQPAESAPRTDSGKVRGDEINDAQRAAVESGLKWLAGHQGSDGGYGGSPYGGAAKHAGITALAGLAFMQAGNLPGRGKYGTQVQKCLDFVLSSSQQSGLLCSDFSQGPMYGHGFATLFLGEMYGMTGDERIKERLELAVKLIEKCQNPEGGWRYQPAPYDADISVTICQIMALRAARDAGVKVEKEVIDKAVRYVRSCQGGDGGFSYQPSMRGAGSGYARTAAGVASLFYAGIYEGADVDRGLKYLKQYMPGKSAEQGAEGMYFYGNYYAVQAMFLAGGDYWGQFYPAIRDQLIARQDRSDGKWQGEAGEEYATSMALIILQMPNRYLPVYAGKGPGS